METTVMQKYKAEKKRENRQTVQIIEEYTCLLTICFADGRLGLIKLLKNTRKESSKRSSLDSVKRSKKK